MKHMIRTTNKGLQAIVIFVTCINFWGTSLAETTNPRELTYPDLQYSAPIGAEFRTVLTNGMILYVAEDHMLPIVEMKLQFQGGTAHDPAHITGLAELLGQSLVAGGTLNHPGSQLQNQLALVGGAISVEV